MNYFKILEKNVKGYPKTFYIEFLIREDMVELENMGHPRMNKIIDVKPVIKETLSNWNIVKDYLIGVVVDIGDTACAEDSINYNNGKGNYYYWPDAKDNIVLLRRCNDGKGNRRTWWRMTESGNTEFPV